MKLHEVLTIVAIYSAAVFFGYLAATSFEGFLPYYVMFLAVFFTITMTPYLVDYILSRQRFSFRILLLTGRGYDERTEELIKKVVYILTTVGFSIAALAMSYSLFFSSQMYYIIGIVSAGATAFVLFIVMSRTKVLVSTRKESVEVELPLLMIFMYGLSALGLSLYDIVNVVSNSISLKAWANEMSLLKRVMYFTGSSLYRAFSMVISFHPSKTVKDMFSRIAEVAKVVGDISDSVRRLFDFTYEKYVKELQNAEVNFASVATLLLFINFLVGLSLIVALVAGGVYETTIYTTIVGVNVLTGVLTYLSVVSVYPRQFELLFPKNAFILATSVYGAVAALYVLSGLEVMTGKTYFGLEPYMLMVIAAIISFPLGAIGAAEERKFVTEAKVISLMTDAAETSEVTGLNVLMAAKNIASEHGKKYVEFINDLENVYATRLAQYFILQRHTMLTRAYFETLIHLLRRGVPSTVLTDISRMYEKMLNLWRSLSSKAITLFSFNVLFAIIMLSLGYMFTWAFSLSAGKFSMAAMPTYVSKIPILKVLTDPQNVWIPYKAGALYALSLVLSAVSVVRSKYGNMISAAKYLSIYSAVLAVTFFILEKFVVIGGP